MGPLAGQGQHPLCRVDPGQEPGWLCRAGTSQHAWEDADTVQTFGGLELRWLGSGPALGPEPQGETEADEGRYKEKAWKGSLSKAVEPERNFMGLSPKPFLSSCCVPRLGLLATELNRMPMNGSPQRSWWAEIC